MSESYMFAGGITWMPDEPQMDIGPHSVTRAFEAALCRYTGAPFAVCVNSCTAALMLAVAWQVRQTDEHQPYVEIPKRTYVGVPMSIIHAGARVAFRDEDWVGNYQLAPYPVWDSARLFRAGMYDAEGEFVCVSFHASKTLGIEQGGCILHSDPAADEWFRRMRFDGRTQGIPVALDDIREIGWHCYMNPSTAAQGLLRLHSLPAVNAPIANDPYPDLSLMEIFQ